MNTTNKILQTILFIVAISLHSAYAQVNPTSEPDKLLHLENNYPSDLGILDGTIIVQQIISSDEALFNGHLFVCNSSERPVLDILQDIGNFDSVVVKIRDSGDDLAQLQWNNTSLDLSALSPGYYDIHLISDDLTIIVKIAKP